MSYNISPSLPDLFPSVRDSLEAHPCCCKWYYVILFNGWINFPWIYVPHVFVYPSVNGHLVCFKVFTVVNSASVKTGVHVSFGSCFSPDYMPRSGITGSYDSSIWCFVRNPYTVLTVAIPNYTSINSVGRFPSHHTLSSICYFVDFLMIIILASMKCYFIVILICISLIISVAEHFFMCLLAIWCFIWRMSVESFCPFFKCVVCLMMLNIISYL